MKKNLYILLAILSQSFVVFIIKAQTPFSCSDLMYEVSGSGSSSSLRTIDVNTGVTTLIASYTVQTNAIDFNTFDNLIWGVQDGNQLVRIDATGTVYPVTVTGLTLTGPVCGAISSLGYYYVTAGATLTDGYYVINVNPGSPDYLQIVNPLTFAPILSTPYTTAVVNPAGVTGVGVADWAFRSADGMLWSVSNQAAGLIPTSQARMFTMNPGTGVITLETPALSPALGNLGSWGSVIIDATGFMYAKRNANGDIYEVDMSTGTYNITSSSGIGVGFNDGAVCPSAIVLPLNLLSFNVDKIGNTAILQWITANEQNNKGFYVMHSIDGADWEELDFVPAKNSSNSIEINYSFRHEVIVHPTHYYKIKQVDLDGKLSFSNTLYLKFSDYNKIAVYPNPITDNLVIKGLNPGNTISLTNVTGVLLITKTANEQTELINTNHLVQGIYFVTVYDPLTGEKIINRIVKE